MTTQLIEALNEYFLMVVVTLLLSLIVQWPAILYFQLLRMIVNLGLLHILT